jgi:peptide methionine sulfoxide reductase msrA/msrB
MKNIILLIGIAITTQLFFAQCNGTKSGNLTLKKEYVKQNDQPRNKRTETPFSGIYDDFFEEGTYVCSQCKTPLYYSNTKFDAHCGWPAFDDEIDGAVKRVPDGYRTEIVCANCGAHLGHVFLNEGFTKTNTRHCVNSYAMDFIPKDTTANGPAKAYFAEGCFWGAEYWLEKQEGVISAVSGYAGGNVESPTYRQVSSGRTGHVETVEVTYDPKVISYDKLVKVFFNTHDFTQTDGQGPDIGSQYLSVIFYTSEAQRLIALKIKQQLIDKGYKVATEIKKATGFYPAEAYHQDYYEHKGTKPYCHIYEDKFNK